MNNSKNNNNSTNKNTGKAHLTVAKVPFIKTGL